MNNPHQIVYTCYLLAEIIHNSNKEFPPIVKCVYLRSEPGPTLIKGYDIHESHLNIVQIMKIDSTESFQDAIYKMEEYIQYGIKMKFFPKWIEDYRIDSESDFDEYQNKMALIRKAKALATRPIYSLGGVFEPEDSIH